CAGLSWDYNGDLVVVGGQGNWRGTGVETYKFYPRYLGGIVLDIHPPYYPHILTNPWVQIGNMILPRYYPTLITLNQESIPATTPGSCSVPIPTGGASL